MLPHLRFSVHNNFVKGYQPKSLQNYCRDSLPNATKLVSAPNLCKNQLRAFVNKRKLTKQKRAVTVWSRLIENSDFSCFAI